MDVQAFRSQIVSLALLFLIYLTQCTTGESFSELCALVPDCRISDTCVNTINIMSSAGVRIEPHHKSHVKMAFTPRRIYDIKARLSFDFRTPSSDGIVFYARTSNDQDLIALTLNGSKLIFKIRCSGLNTDILLLEIYERLVWDSTWHTVEFAIEMPTIWHGTHTYLQIDSITASRYAVNCGPLTKVVMGGYSEEDGGNIYGLENLPGHFEGCIRNFSSKDRLRYPPKSYTVSVCY